jgi:hypothetical protein
MGVLVVNGFFQFVLNTQNGGNAHVMIGGYACNACIVNGVYNHYIYRRLNIR